MCARALIVACGLGAALLAPADAPADACDGQVVVQAFWRHLENQDCPWNG